MFQAQTEKLISSVLALTAPYDDSLSPICGIDRFGVPVGEVQYDCLKCIGACCLRNVLPDINAGEAAFLMSKCGTIPEAFLLQDQIQATAMRLASNAVFNLRPGTDDLRLGARVANYYRQRMSDVAHLPPNKSFPFKFFGPCGALTADGRCSINEQPGQPRICRDFIRGNPKCMDSFIARNSPAARVVENILNQASPLFVLFAALMRAKRSATSYSFK